MGGMKCRSVRSGAATAALMAGSVWLLLQAPASAGMRYGPLQLSGNLETQNLIRHSDVDKLEFIQNRNTFRLRADWDWVKNGKLLDGVNIPFVKRAKLFLLYRGVYDGFYDVAPSDRQHGQTRFDDFVGGRITDFPHDVRDGLKFENRLREAYLDLSFTSLPVSFRLGRQQVVWGESDQFRMTDIWNPLDLTWHFHQESWDNIRIPLWLAKALWDIGDVGPLSTVFVEAVYNPGDFHPGIKAGFLPQPWALPFADPVRGGQINNINPTLPLGPGSVLLSPNFCPDGVCLQGTSVRRGDFHRNPADASEVGLRLHFITPQGLELTTNYLYGRGRGIGAASPFGIKIESADLVQFPFGTPLPQNLLGQYQPDFGSSTVLPVIPVNIRAKFVHPYVHIFGLTGNYFEENFTQAVLRFETAYAIDEPFQTVEREALVPLTFQGQPHPVLAGQTAPLGFTKRDVWAGMVGFDRPTWIRWLNAKSTWFISFQLFWNYTTGGNIDDLRGLSGAGDVPYFGPLGQWTEVAPLGRSLGIREGQVERQQDGTILGNGDKVRRWEHLVTLAASSIYRGGTIVPFIANAWDPVNGGYELMWTLDYFLRNDLIITLSQRYFMKYGGSGPSGDPWFLGRLARRDETGLKLTYQF